MIPRHSPFPLPLGRMQAGTFYVTGFQTITPRFRTAQCELLSWLAEAHERAGGIERPLIEALFARYSASAEHIHIRGHEPADFTHRRWDEMEFYGPKGSDLGKKTRFFDERTGEILQTFYPEDATPPDGLVHVTCTGYAAPSSAQRLVSLRGWGQQTQVLHAYHMGCYAAHPAVRMAAGLAATTPNRDGAVDIVHTEICSLHLDPALHDPAQLVIQSLFADGFIKYQVVGAAPREENPLPGLAILAARDVIIPDSTEAMKWSTGPLNFTMGLSKEVPTLFASALPRFVATLFEEAGLDWATEKTKAFFAIHPGGPRIIELSQKILGLDPARVYWSRRVLREHGNMSSATLPHIWERVLLDDNIPDGTLVASLGAGPGLTLSGLLFHKRL
jgi:predicted naringenin-chalcone synthase